MELPSRNTSQVQPYLMRYLVYLTVPQIGAYLYLVLTQFNSNLHKSMDTANNALKNAEEN